MKFLPWIAAGVGAWLLLRPRTPGYMLDPRGGGADIQPVEFAGPNPNIAALSRGYAQTSSVRQSQRVGSAGYGAASDWSSSGTGTTVAPASSQPAAVYVDTSGRTNYVAQPVYVGGVTDPESQITAAAPAPEYRSTKTEELADTKFFSTRYA